MSDKNSDKFLSQVVVRHLPPTMTGEQFMNEISPVPAHNYFHFLKADLSLGQRAFTRACLNFTRKDEIFIFKDKFDGYVFLDSNGTEYPAIVEFSPYQKTPRRRINSKGEPLTCKQRDSKCNTIQDDPDFKSFMENLNTSDSEKNSTTVEDYLVEIEAREKEMKANHGASKIITPLIEFIMQKKADKLRLKEERRLERRKQAEQKKARDDGASKKDDKINKVKQRERKNKAKGNITVAKNDKGPKEKEKVKGKETQKEKEKDKDNDKDDKDNKDNKDKDKDDKDKDKPPGRENPRRRNRKKDRDNGDKEKNTSSTAVNKDTGKESDKKDKNLDKNRYFVVTYSGDKGGDRKFDSSSKKQSHQPSVSKIETNPNNETKTPKKENEASTNQNAQSQSKESNDLDSQRVRNKDRPALEIYRPRRARNQSSGSNGNSESGERNSKNKPEKNMRKTKVFTRSRNTE